MLPKGSLNLDLAPELEAIDLHVDSRVSDPYEVTWRQLAAVLGVPAPWFHPTLRDRDTIAMWKPGIPPAIIPANHIELPTRALIELAADEPDGSPPRLYACGWPAIFVGRIPNTLSSSLTRSAPRPPIQPATAHTYTSPPAPGRCCGPRTPSQMRWSAVPGGRRSSSGAMFSPQPPPKLSCAGTAGNPGQPGRPPSSSPYLAQLRASGPLVCDPPRRPAAHRPRTPASGTRQ